MTGRAETLRGQLHYGYPSQLRSPDACFVTFYPHNGYNKPVHLCPLHVFGAVSWTR